MYFTYVLYSDKLKKYYTGYTKDIDKRIVHHNIGLNKWSKRGIPWELVYSEIYSTKSEAIKRENYLKTGKGREFIKGRVAKVVKAHV